MEIIIELLKLLASLGALLFLAERLIDAAVKLSRAFGVSPAVIGLTLLAYGTSLPEFAVTSLAAVKGYSSIAIANVIGSNIYNIAVVMGIVSLMTPITVRDGEFIRRDGIVMLFATALLSILIAGGGIGRPTGMVMVLSTVYYTHYILKDDRTNSDIEPDARISWEKEALVVILLMGGVLVSGNVCVDAAANLAKLAGVSEWVIGATIIAAGTSLPETVVSIIAAKRGEFGMAIGNIVGSNTFNILWILGFASILNPLPVTISSTHIDLIFLSAVSILFYAGLARKKLSRVDGGLYLAIYSGYILYQFAFN